MSESIDRVLDDLRRHDEAADEVADLFCGDALEAADWLADDQEDDDRDDQ